MTKGGWDKVRRAGRDDQGGVFLNIKDGETVQLRILDDAPFPYRIHHITAEVNGESKYLPLPATERADESFVFEQTRRFPADERFALRCAKIGEDLEVESAVVLTGGMQIFRPLLGIIDRHGDLQGFDIEVTREGEGRNTKYQVNIPPRSAEIDDVGELADELLGPELDWGILFPSSSYEEQKTLLETAGIDLSHDPAVDLAGEMSVDDARDTGFDFGKYSLEKAGRRGARTVGQVMDSDPGYINWILDECHNASDHVRAACMVALQNRKKLTAGKARPAVADTKKKAGPVSKKKATPKRSVQASLDVEDQEVEEAEVPAKASRDEYTRQIQVAFNDADRFPEAADIVATIKHHGGGKTKLRDLNMAQLQSLLEEIDG